MGEKPRMNILSKIRNVLWPPYDEPQVQVKIVSSHTLTLIQWRKQEKLVADAIALARNGTFQMMLQVLHNDHPARNGFASIGTSMEDRAAHEAKIEGYEACLNKIKEMSQPWTISKPLIATFQPPSDK
jgi:hypothetical protein